MNGDGNRPDADTRPVGMWHAVARGWRVFVPAILVYAVAQYLLLLPTVTPAVTPLFLALVAVAYLLDVLLAAVCSIAASAGARRLSLAAALPRGRRARTLVATLGWSAVWVLLVSLVGVWSAIAAAIVLLVGVAVMPAVVAGRGFAGWLRPLRRTPVRTLVWGALAYLAIVASAFADAEIGFLVQGALGAALARVVTGVIAVVLLCSSAVNAERAEHAEARAARSASRLAAGADAVADASESTASRRSRRHAASARPAG